MPTYQFDDRNIFWCKLGGFENFFYSILDIDKENKIIDVLFKFEPNKPIILHRHTALNKMLVIQGEHRLYLPNGDIKEVRPVGTYTSSPAHPEPHRECGGNNGAVVFFSIRGQDGVLYELLDDEQNIIGTLTMQNFVDLYHTAKR